MKMRSLKPEIWVGPNGVAWRATFNCIDSKHSIGITTGYSHIMNYYRAFGIGSSTPYDDLFDCLYEEINETP